MAPVYNPLRVLFLISFLRRPPIHPLQTGALAILVFGLFGLMHIVAGLVFVTDKVARRDLSQRLIQLRVRAAAGGAGSPLDPDSWAWMFALVRPRGFLLFA